MKLVITLIIASVFSVSASTYSQTLTISKKALDLPVFFKIVNEQTGYAFVFNKDLLATVKPIDVQVKNELLESVLTDVLYGTGLKYEIKYKTIIITKRSALESDAEPADKSGAGETKNKFIEINFQQKISGKVTDQEGRALPGASIRLLGKSMIKMTTDGDGNFTINTIPADSALQVSYIGYKTRTVPLVKGKTNYNISLKITDAGLKDVIITGVFDKPKESYTGAVTVISKEQLKLFGNRNLLKTIGNIDPSFDIQETNNYGSDPNQTPNIEIRGSSTIGDVTNLQTNRAATLNQPLYILDGFEVTIERVMDMNQTDVESVVILKDASSTAIYGSRGANGVVVITSVKPVAGKLRLVYTGGLNLEIPDLSSYNQFNSVDKLALEQRAGLYTSTSLLTQNTLTALYNTNLKAAVEGVNTNWAKVPTQTGVGQYHKLDISGGDAQFRYIMNGSYNQIKGSMQGTDRDNFNGSMTIMYLMDKVRFSNNLSIGLNTANLSSIGQFSEYLLMNPYWSPFASDGTANKTFSSFGGASTIYNPYYNSTLTDFYTKKYTTIRNNTQVDWDITKAIKWTNAIGFNKQVGSSDNFSSPSNTTFINTTDINNKGSYSKSNDEQQNYQFSTTLSYNQIFGKHSIFLGLSGQALETTANVTQIKVTGFINDTQTDISNGLTYSGLRPTTTSSTIRTVGSTASMSYIYDSRFFADASYRLDGASSFGSNSRFGNFWSAGLGWTVSNEKFMQEKLPAINQLRLRYSYGVSGSLNFSPADALTTYTYDTSSLYRYLIGTSITGFGNDDLKWQNTYQQNFGLDFALFNNKVVFSANSYIKNTNNAITQGTLAYSHGFSTYTQNVGKVRNTGTDMMATVNILRNSGEHNLNWSVSLASYHNKNILVKLSDAIKKANAINAGLSTSFGTSRQYVEGESMDEIYVYDSPGVDAATGQVLYRDAAGNITTNTANLTKIAVGSAQPKINGRLSTMLRYGSFIANIGFAGRFGGKKLNSTLLGKVENSYVRSNLDVRAGGLRWQNPGDITAFKDIRSETSTQPNTRFVFTENTVTLNNVNLQYELPLRWIKRLNMQRFAVSASMSDVFYWSNIEQERGTAYPYSLKPSFSLSATF